MIKPVFKKVNRIVITIKELISTILHTRLAQKLLIQG